MSDNYEKLKLKELISKLVFQHAAVIEFRDDNGCTAFILSCYSNQIDLVKILIDHGAKIQAKDNFERTGFSLACEEGHFELVKLLINHGAVINTSDDRKRTGFSYACQEGHFEIVTLLIELGVSIDDKCQSGFTPLMYACHYGHIEIVKLLLKSGVNMEEKNNAGQTAFLLAVNIGNKKLVELLIEFGVNIHETLHIPWWYTDTYPYQDDEIVAENPLKTACSLGHIDVIKLLIQSNADINVKDTRNETILHRMLEKNDRIIGKNRKFIPILEILIEEGIDLESKNNRGESAFYVAADGRHPHLEIMVILIHFGVSWEITNEWGDKLLHNLSKENKIKFCELLEEKKKENDYIFETLHEFWCGENISDQIINTIFEFYCQPNNYDEVLQFLEVTWSEDMIRKCERQKNVNDFRRRN